MSRHPSITAEQAERAIYLDFEGNTDDAPAVLGTRIDGQAEHVILEEQLTPLTALTNPRHTVTTAPLDEALDRIRRQAQGEGRLVVGFTLHDRMIVTTYATDQDLIGWFAEAYVNAKKPIDRWLREQVSEGLIDPPIDKSLRSSMRAIGMDYKPGAGINVVGKTLTRLRKALAKQQDATTLTPRTKAAWWKVLSHNSTDLDATEELLCRATTGGAR